MPSLGVRDVAGAFKSHCEVASPCPPSHNTQRGCTAELLKGSSLLTKPRQESMKVETLPVASPPQEIESVVALQ